MTGVPHLRRSERRDGAGHVLPARSTETETAGADLRPVLEAAAARVLGGWRDDRADALDAKDVSETIHWLVDATVAALAGEAIPSQGPAATVLGRRLLELLRAAVLAEPREPQAQLDPKVLVLVLRAVEQVREAVDPDWSQALSSRLSAPSGLDLVVEVAHDLRSPITSILFLAETLQRGQSGTVNEVQHRQLGLIYAAALGLSSMASDVIELARGGKQLVEKEPAPLSVTAILESVRDIVHPIAEEKGLSILLVPPVSDHRMGRQLALSRVLLNLTTNALKFTDEGCVEIAARPRGLTQMEFSVRDTGHGISPEAMDNLYQPFRRSRARAGRSGYYFSGTGLGLAMCRLIVEAMDSELEFETEQGRGTRFFFKLNLPPVTNL
ncbi:MAG TPA: HAMP domain-containing sensor histidine kinase [Gemmatimonadales bacterium]|nr:HAMP domain-containing sensor histidine kinase [Gemmatimonadales bacterium]